MNSPIIAPSLLAADFSNLLPALELVNRSAADWLHFDVMDGHFVPNISFGLPLAEAVSRHLTKPLDVHLMIEKPERYLEAFRDAGAAHLSVHWEACPNLHRTLQQIKELGCKAGIAINPHTPVSLLEDILFEADIILVMSVNPGFGGQKFIEHTYEKVSKLRAMSDSVIIEVDGGVNLQNASRLIEAGANAFVAGNFVFSSPDPESVIAQLKALPGR